MASGASIEILDLRHFQAPALRSVLEAEGELWKRRLHWDYRVSTNLLLQYLDGRLLPGFAALESDRVVGYTFCVYEENKAVIGDLFALPTSGGGARSGSPAPADAVSAHGIEEMLLRHLLELLENSPQIDRIESQLLLQPSGSHVGVFFDADFQIYRRLFMARTLKGFHAAPRVSLPPGLELRLWHDEDLEPASRLIAAAYQDHPDSVVNDQYHSAYGALRFLNNIVHYSGCGAFSSQVSHVVVDRRRRELAALVLASRVSLESGHITQICVHPEFRRRGLARMLLNLAASGFQSQGVGEISLTVTETNSGAIALYHAEGYTCAYRFDATVWQRNRIA